MDPEIRAGGIEGTAGACLSTIPLFRAWCPWMHSSFVALMPCLYI